MARNGDGDRIEALEAEVYLRDARLAALAAEVDDLRNSRAHAAVIEQAKGAIMVTMDCEAEAAFAVLIAASQREHEWLHVVAQRLLDDLGQPPTAP
ncbi:MAG: hypothetical protein JWO77_1039 [Ilumatobacteraceae bacterium]|nr:hypothetical protein [Ilumatobacteraceae bacterium]